METKVDIVSVHGHYEVHINGKFHCSADTRAEAVTEMEALLNDRKM